MNKSIGTIDKITSKTAAEILGVSPITIYGYVRQGKLKAYKDCNGKLYFTRYDIEEFKNRAEELVEVVPADVPDNAPITGKAFNLKSFRGYSMTIKDVAALLGFSERWCEKHMNNGTFPIRWYSIGERIRVIDSADLDEYLAKTVISAGTAPLPLKAVSKLKKEVAVKK